MSEGDRFILGAEASDMANTHPLRLINRHGLVAVLPAPERR